MLENEFAHLDGLVDRLLGAVGQPHTLTGAERERLVKETFTTNVDALVPLITAVEFLAKKDPNVAFDADLRGPLLRSNEGVTTAGRSWLHVACARGDLDTAIALLERCGLHPTQAEPDIHAQTPLHVAAARGHLEVVAFLLKCGAGDDLAKQDGKGRTPLECAEHNGHAQVAGFIKWWDPSPSWSLDEGQEEEKKTAPQSDLLSADDAKAEKGGLQDDQKKKMIVKKTNAPILRDPFSHLEGVVARLFGVVGERLALKSGRSRRMLTEAERDALVDEAWTAANDVGALIPLILAVKFLASASSVELDDELREPLLRSNKGFTYKHRSWFHVACARGDLDAATALVEGCGLDATQAEPDINKETPLHTAAQNGFVDVVAFLLTCGLDEAQKDLLGRTPRECASAHPEVAGLFKALAKSSSSCGVARRVAKRIAESAAADVDSQASKDPILPKGTRIEDQHDHLASWTRVITDCIGRGTFGNVYTALHPRAQREEAVKVVRFVDEKGKPLGDAERIERLRSQVDEAEIMLKLGLHLNLVAIRFVCLLRSMQDSSGEAVAFNLYLFMDYIEGAMTLKVCSKKLDMDVETKVRLARDVAQGLDHIRKCFPNYEYTYWDLKPGNVLVECSHNEDGALVPKRAVISDFGVAMTTAYASHETFIFFTYGVESELAARTQHEWSWATTFLAVLVGERSWDDYNGAVLELRRQLEFVPQLGDNDGNLFLSCLRLCERCMDPDPTLRCSMHNVIAELSRMLADVDEAPPLVVERDRMELASLHTSIGLILSGQLTKSSKDYARAEEHLVTANELLAAVEGEESDLFATSLNNLAMAFEDQGKYDKAKPLYERAIAITEKTLGGEHPNLANRLNNFAGLLEAQGKYDDAKPLYERATAITENTLGAEHPSVAKSLNNLGVALQAQGNYDDAKPLYERAIAIGEKTLGAEHPRFATWLSNLAGLFTAQGKYDEAKPLFERVIAIGEKTLGAEHPSLATSLNNLAILLQAQGKYDEAIRLYERDIAIAENVLGAEHPDVATSLNNLAGLLQAQGKLREAIALYERAIAIGEKTLDGEHPKFGTWLSNLARVLQAQGKYDEAKPLFERAIAIGERTLGAEHPDLATRLNNLATLLQAQGKYDEAKPLYERDFAITVKALGAEHPHLAVSLNNLASLLKLQGKYDEARQLCERAMHITEKALGAEHPDLATRLNNLASLLHDQGNYDEAKPLYERAIAIGEKTLGAEHPDLAKRLNNMAVLLTQQGKYDESMTLLKRAHAIFLSSLGPDHKETKITASRMQQVKTLAANNATSPVRPIRHDILQPGTRVIVQHIRTKPELNGLVGRVGKFDDTEGRYAVKLEDQDVRAIALMPHNVMQMIEDVQLVDETNSEFRGAIVGSRLDGTEVLVRASDAGEEDEAWIPVDRLRLPSGTPVKIVGLNSRRDLNGSRATIVSWDSTAGRYVVQLSAIEKIKLKPVNLTIAC